MSGTTISKDGKERCSWCASTPEFIDYHDNEWGFPVGDDYRLFEKICLESFQSGLSWRTILSKRENFRKAFDNFNFNKIACYDQTDIERLLNDTGIVRHRGKIEATINNAQKALLVAKQYGSLAKYFWSFEPEKKNYSSQTQSSSSDSVILSKSLKKMGWKFVGPTTVYAFMQAAGLINDHEDNCSIRKNVEIARRNFVL